MTDDFKVLFDQLQNNEFSEVEAIGLLAGLRQKLQRTVADVAQPPLLATLYWQAQASRIPAAGADFGTYDTVVLVCNDAGKSADWVGELAAGVRVPRVVQLQAPKELLARLAHADDPAEVLAEHGNVFGALDIIAHGDDVAVLFLDDLYPEIGASDAPSLVDGHYLYLGRLLWTFALMQDLLKRRSLRHCHVLNLVSLQHALPLTAGLQGVLKTSVLESSRTACATVWLSGSNEPRSLVRLAAQELLEFAPGHYRDIAWFDGLRHTRALKETSGSDRPVGAVLFDPNDRVLITGGAGGLGRAIAERLTGQFGVQVVLCGRRLREELDLDQRDWLARHSRVRYLCVDVNDPEQVRELMADFRRSGAGLAAIFHAAGQTDDGPFLSKKLGSVRAVLSPKVLGSYWLDHYAAELDVRYFACFSSIASLAGSAGQADYAGANGFMDDFCRIRRSLTSAGPQAGHGGCQYVSINWPYWLEGGMRADTERLGRLTAQSGLESLDASTGWESLLDIMARPEPQVVVLPGNHAKLRQVFFAPATESEARREPAERPELLPSGDRTGKPVAEDLEKALRELIAKTLKMDEDMISEDESFDSYGFDSILLTELATAINRRYPEITSEVDVFLDHSTLRELADWMLARVSDGGGGDERDGNSRLAVASFPGDLAAPEASIFADEANGVLLAKLREMASTILKLPGEDIDAHTPWADFGFDSISLNEFALLIGRAFPAISIATDLFLSCATLAELVEMLSGHQPVAPMRAAPPAQPAPPKDVYVAPARVTDPEKGDAESDSLEIAIIGVAGRFPAAADLSEFWKNLIEDRGAVTSIPPDRWRWQDYAGDPRQEQGKTDCHHASFLTDIDKFDAPHFNISPREAELMDPQQRLLLECAWEAFENAAIDPSSAQGRKVGVFFGAEKSDYLSLIVDAKVDMDPYINTGNALVMLANRVSYFFGLTGPSITLNTACSSSFAAIHAAISSLRNGESEMALAGGVNILLSPGLFVLNRKMGMLTADDHIKPFDKDASGHLFGEGLGLVLLKPLKRAMQDGDPIHGVIKAMDVAHGGHGRFLTTPNAPSHEALICEVLKRANTTLEEVDYLEAQGSGDQITDRMELDTYHSLLRGLSRSEPLRIGSIKGHTGHLGAASGVTALIKVLLCLNHNRLLPILHHRQLNWQGAVPFAGRLLTSREDWQPKTIAGEVVPRMAGLHNFGYGGVNGHMIIREFLKPDHPSAGWPAAARLWVFSARTAEQLKQVVARFCRYVTEGGHRLYGQHHPSVEQIAYTLQIGRQAMGHRLALTVDEALSDEQALDETSPVMARLQNWLDQGRLGDGMWQGVVSSAKVATKEDRAGMGRQDSPATLAQRWIKGAPIGWESYYKDARPPRLSLPAYPFAPTRHWVVSSVEEKLVAEQASSSPALHPLLHGNVEGDRTIQFSSTFHGDECFFRDHRIQGLRTLPGAAYCEMALAAVALATPEFARTSIGYCLENIVWTRPLTISDQPVQVSLVMDPEGSGGVEGHDAFRFSVRSNGGSSSEVLSHAQGMAYPERRDAITRPAPVTIKRLPVYTNGTRVDSGQLYGWFRDLGFDYGSSHQCLGELFYQGDEVLARLRLPETLEQEGQDFILHPGLLDGALQASIGFSIQALEKGSGAATGPLIPFGLERLRCYRMEHVTRDIRWVRLRRQKTAHANPVVKLDVDLLDGDGVICISLEGYSARQGKGGIVRTADATALDIGGRPSDLPLALPLSATWRTEDGERLYPCSFQQNDIYLRDHQVDGHFLLPAMALIDLARLVADTLPTRPDAKVLRISRATWQRPLFVEQSGRSAALWVSDRGDDGWAMVLESDGVEAGVAVAYARCDLAWTTAEPGMAASFDAAQDGRRYLNLEERSRLLEISPAAGMHDGTSLLRAIEVLECSRSDDAMWLTLARGGMGAGQAAASTVTTFGLLLSIVKICGEKNGPHQLAVPYSMEKCLLYRAFPETVKVAIIPAGQAEGSRYRQYDISIVDMAGAPVMHIAGLIMVLLEKKKDAEPYSSPIAISVIEEIDDDAAQVLHRKMRELIGELQKISPDSIGLDDDLTSFGLDSFSFTELSNRVNRQLGINTMPTVFFEHDNLRALVDGLLRQYPELDTGTRKTREEAWLDVPSAVPRPLTGKPSGPSNAMQDVGSPYREPVHAPKRNTDAIAIIGMAGRFPGADNLEDFWKNLVENHDSVGKVPTLRQDQLRPHGDEQGGEDARQTARAGLLSDIAGFDAEFFDIQALEARRMDPQLRLSLETGWHLLEDAGIPASRLRGSDTAVYMGVSSTDYRTLWLRKNGLDDLTREEQLPYMIANRFSYIFDLRGPSEVIDTACSSSLIALRRGMESLRQGQCQLAVVGGVNIIALPEVIIGAGGSDWRSEDGRCKSFDARADGYGRSEGVGMLLLKRLEDAERDGNRIHAVILGAEENHCGHTLSPALPSSDAQRLLLVKAYRQAGLEPGRVGYIEAHGIGTLIGDTIECEALRQAFADLHGQQRSSPDPASCALGSVKTNIGHLEAASGIAGVIKVALMLRHRKIPGNPQLQEVNPHLELDGSPFYLTREPREWQAVIDGQDRALPLLAGVNSFGRGGVNAHAILQQYLRTGEKTGSRDKSWPAEHAIVLSAKSKEALIAQTLGLMGYIQSLTASGTSSVDAEREWLHDIAYTLQGRREALEWRFGVIVGSLTELQQQLQIFAKGSEEAGVTLANYGVSKILQANQYFTDDEDMRALAGQWLAQGRVDKLLKLWMDGVPVDWDVLYRERPATFVDLPLYPFTRKPFWLDSGDAASETLVAEAADVPKDANEVVFNRKPIGDALNEHVRRLLAEALSVQDANLDDLTPLSTLTLDASNAIGCLERMNERLGMSMTLGSFVQHSTVGDLCIGVRKVLQRRDRGVAKNYPVSSLVSPTMNDFSTYYRMAFGSVKAFKSELVELGGNVRLEVLHNIDKGKPLLVLLPPMACLATIWLRQVQYFANRYSVIICHYPGHGLSSGLDTVDDRELGVQSIAKLIWALLDHYRMHSPVHLVGWSMGGLIGQCMVAEQPGRVATLTLVNSVPALIDHDQRGLNDAMRELINEVSIALKPAINEYFGGDFKAIKACYDANVFDAYLALVKQTQTSKALDKLIFPALVIAGEEDRVIMPETSRRLYLRLSQASFHLLDDGGHFLPVTHADWFNRRLEEHFSGVSPYEKSAQTGDPE
ncbi:alpha/beta fold hydrolase [Agrobacterium rhizogenes]|uniref:alpha/beta fold hydrolase n=1 Tax=Rhizobium rhizogenes TaxID=359 RepID=UPI0015730475|nr:alpha/beta fold hydrolase [Rhizobium rhizogenes]NTG51718.1 alpha/beta fold hydrolase [Rhizobium rhizogenes]